MYPGDGSGGFTTRIPVSWAADGMDYVVNAGRWNGGGAPDVLMRGADSRRLFLYDGTGAGLMQPPITLGGGWGVMRSIVGVNDITGDANADLVAIDSSGTILVYPGNGRGGFLAVRQVGSMAASALVS